MFVKEIKKEIRDGKRGLVRGYAIYSQWRAGCIGLEQAKDDNIIEVGVAYTHWHRHDENPEVVCRELDLLRDCYSCFDGYEGMMFGYEWKEYRK